MYEATGQFYALFGPAAPLTAAEQEFLVRWAAGRRAALDLGCGLCGPSFFIASLGLDVLAFEPSPTLAPLALDRIGQAPAEAQRALTFVHCPTTALDEPFRADLILMRSVWMLLDDEQRLECMSALSRHSMGGARLIIDARTSKLAWADTPLRVDEKRIGNSVFSRHTHYTRLPHGTAVHCSVRETRFDRLVTEREETFFVRADTAETVRRSLLQFDFDIEASYASYDLADPPGPASPMIVAVASRR
jgi:SAM-dependent methyltransferase